MKVQADAPEAARCSLQLTRAELPGASALF